MNVIFLDFDGVLFCLRDEDNELERRIALLSKLCKETDSKVVISAAGKKFISEKTGRPYSHSGKWLKDIYLLFDKYDVECIGRTPNVERRFSDIYEPTMWKEDEIRKYLFNHPEVDHYCVIDDDDCSVDDDYSNSDLNKVRNHLVTTIYYSRNHEEVGLLEKHIDEAKEAMKIDNEVKRFALKRRSVK